MDTSIVPLVESARRGDTSAFATIYEGYFAPIYRFVYTRVRHKETAEDLAQETFLRAFSKISTYEERGTPLVAWLYTIARNLCTDYFKKKKEVIPSDPDIFWQDKVSSTHNPLQVADRAERASVLLDCIGELPEAQSEFVLLRFIEELEYAEIAVILGKREEALRALSHRASKNLKKLLQARGIDI